ncbi:hypothetical protein KBZ07_09310 [Cyanobium sp. BA20m-14]|uniref:DUF6447 family protein n=1 Tax=Cyanobium sp. BA20m-14 TaxID=2823703 RepID=UPI0020CEBA3D|nr:DUF6447 family protein [Cyanobium sp. BA20m-14]MCP9913601.1 hypothetical protein [Cyanobium sp. BA20m-14]
MTRDGAQASAIVGGKIGFAFSDKGMAVRNMIFKGRQYVVDDLPEEAKQLLGLLQAAGDQITRGQASVAIAETARQVLGAKLDQLLRDVPSSEVSDA